jgi:hypothetical protein
MGAITLTRISMTDQKIGEELPVETARLRKRSHFGAGSAAREELWHNWV